MPSILKMRAARLKKPTEALLSKPVVESVIQVPTAEVIALKTNQRFKAILANIPLALLAKLANTPSGYAYLVHALERTTRELETDPGARALYEGILLNEKREVLESHGKDRVQKLSEFTEVCDVVQGRAIEEWIQGAQVVRADHYGTDQFLAPRTLQKASSFGCQDVIVQADRYVYASLDIFPHHMTESGVAHIIDPQDIAGRAELVMMDAAEGEVYATNHGTSFIRSYLDNLAPLETGKQLLVEYVKRVFVSLDEAKIILSALRSQRAFAQNWSSEDVKERLGALLEANGETISQARINVIWHSMRTIYERTGIVPPIQTEVRIPDAARKMRPSAF